MAGWKTGFGRRLRFYVIGLGLGVLLAWGMLWRGRDQLPGFWPQQQIKDEIKRAYFEGDSLSNCYFNCLGFGPNTWIQGLENSQVIFSQSFPRAKPYRKYLLQQIHHGDSILGLIELKDSTWSLVELQKPEHCLCP